MPSVSTTSSGSTVSARPVVPGRRMRLRPAGTPMKGSSHARLAKGPGRGSPCRTAAVGPQRNACAGSARTSAASLCRGVDVRSTRTPAWGVIQSDALSELGERPCAAPSVTVNAAAGPTRRELCGIRRSCLLRRERPVPFPQPSPPQARVASICRFIGARSDKYWRLARERLRRTVAGGAGRPRGAARRRGRTTDAGSRSGRRPRPARRRPRPARG